MRGGAAATIVVLRAAVPLLLGLALAIAGVAASAAVVAAHGGEGPTLEAFPTEARAGDAVSVFGEDLHPLGPVELVMLTGDGSVHVLEAEADEEGHFTASFVVPELPERVYELVATDAAGQPASTFLLVGPAESAEAESWLTSTPGLLAIAGVAVLVVGGLLLALRSRRPSRSAGGR